MQKDSLTRTIIKTLFFKILTTSATVWITGMGIGKAVGLHIILTLIYLAYERVWNNIQWGKSQSQELELAF